MTLGAARLHRIPDDATSPDDAMLVADRRMDARTTIGRRSAGRQSMDVLMRAMAKHSPGLDAHIRGVAALADAVGRRLGLDDAERRLVRRAALLHDVGKLAISDVILNKPAALDARERDVVRRHTLVGERILKAAPSLRSVARLVRSSHERWDGGIALIGEGDRDVPGGPAGGGRVGSRPHHETHWNKG